LEEGYKNISEKFANDGDKMKHVISVKVLQKGPPQKASDAVYKSIHLLFESPCNQDIVVLANMLCSEYWKKAQAGENFSDKAIRQRIACWLKSMKIVYRRVTNVAQNTQHRPCYHLMLTWNNFQ
jgi:hypothetical protein